MQTISECVAELSFKMEQEPVKEPTTDTMVVVPWGLVCGSYQISIQSY